MFFHWWKIFCQERCFILSFMVKVRLFITSGMFSSLIYAKRAYAHNPTSNATGGTNILRFVLLHCKPPPCAWNEHRLAILPAPRALYVHGRAPTSFSHHEQGIHAR